MKPALLIIDLQQIYYDTSVSAQPEMDKAIPYINWAAELFRLRKLPVFRIYHIDPQSGCIPEHPGFEMHSHITLSDSDFIIYKKYGNAFLETKLAEKLQELQVDTIFLTGISTEYCVLSTYNGAEGYPVFPIILSNAVASTDGNTDAVLKFTEHISILALQHILR